MARIVLLLAATLSACVTYEPPRAYDFEPTAPFPGASYDEVWDAVIDVFGEQSWPIDQFEKSSGIVTTDWLRAPGGWADCGSFPNAAASTNPLSNEQVRFNIVVRERQGTTTVRVNSIHRGVMASMGLVDCASNGTTEKWIHGLVAEQLDRGGTDG